jgi:hypothetical protein
VAIDVAPADTELTTPPDEVAAGHLKWTDSTVHDAERGVVARLRAARATSRHHWEWTANSGSAPCEIANS